MLLGLCFAVSSATSSKDPVVRFVDGKKLVIMDGVVPGAELQSVLNTYVRADAPKGHHGWSRALASDLSATANAYTKDFYHDECLREPMYGTITRAARQFFPECRSEGTHIAPYQCLLNAQTALDIDSAHVDYPPLNPRRSQSDVDYWGFTAIWYVHEEWDVHWGGSTVFMDHAASDIEAQALPLPQRLVMFDSSMRHMATPPTIIAAPFRNSEQLRNERVLGNRVSYAYKFVCR